MPIKKTKWIRFENIEMSKRKWDFLYPVRMCSANFNSINLLLLSRLFVRFYFRFSVRYIFIFGIFRIVYFIDTLWLAHHDFHFCWYSQSIYKPYTLLNHTNIKDPITVYWISVIIERLTGSSIKIHWVLLNIINYFVSSIWTIFLRTLKNMFCCLVEHYLISFIFLFS